LERVWGLVAGMNRRTFMQAGAAALALSSVRHYAADVADIGNKKRVGLIGTGWYGKLDLFRLIQVAPVEVVSLCDVDKTMLANAADMVATRQASKKKPRTFSDYREMLKEKDLDIVLVGTPDHWHALTMIAAVDAGADVYCQKPTAVDVMESEAMLAAARKRNKVVQIGTQRRSTPHLIEAREQIVKAGKLGKIAHAEVYCYYHMRARDASPDSAAPANLDYEMWTGPAPMRPFHKLNHPRGWRAFMEYGNGIVGDMCVHMLDTVRWILDLGWPKSINSTGGIYVDKASRANISDTQEATFEFDDLTVDWTHRSWGAANDPAVPWGFTIYGDKGTLKGSVQGYEFTPQSGGQKITKTWKDFEGYKAEDEKFAEDRTEKDIEIHVAPAVRRHMANLLENIASRGKPVADIEQGHISSASCILANVAMKLGRTLKYDPKTRMVVGDAEATKLLARPYRAPWKRPTV
jgi:predicted dehydrogenase